MSISKKSRAPWEATILEFSNNTLLTKLTGAHKKNFARLEHLLGVCVGAARFGEKDVVCRALVTRIVSTYNAHDARRGGNK